MADVVDQLTSKGDLNGLPTKIRYPPRSSKTNADRLHIAILMGKYSRIRDIIDNGTSADTRNRDGQTTLFAAAYLGKKEILMELIRLGANPNARCFPDGYTAVHGACYIGSLDILKLLLHANGDLRLTDTKRQRPIDWVEFQPDLGKRKCIRDFIEELRFGVMKMKCESFNLKQELNLRFQPEGINLGAKIRKWLRSNTDKLSDSNSDFGSCCGFGKTFFDQGTKSKCAGCISLPCLNGVTDLKFDDNPKAPSWINGKFTTFIPMTWTKRNTSVILKTLRRKSVEEAVPDMLIAELDVLVRLQHPNILMLLAVCQEENFDSLSLVFEKVAWGSLYHFLHLQGLRMKSALATDVIIQISEALDFVHGSGFLHCGISSHSIMLVSENHAKLTCFEYAIPEDSSEAEKFQSTRHPWLQTDPYLAVIRHWLAPEVMTKTRSFWQGSDVYSLCCVMWEIVVGEVPWKDYNLEALRYLMTESPGVHLPLGKDIIPPLWLSVLQVGLKPKWEDRDLDFKELRYMMSLAKERPAMASGDRHSLSRISLRSASFKRETKANQLNRLPTSGQKTKPPIATLDAVDADIEEAEDEESEKEPEPESSNSSPNAIRSAPLSFKAEAYLDVNE